MKKKYDMNYTFSNDSNNGYVISSSENCRQTYNIYAYLGLAGLIAPRCRIIHRDSCRSVACISGTRIRFSDAAGLCGNHPLRHLRSGLCTSSHRDHRRHRRYHTKSDICQTMPDFFHHRLPVLQPDTRLPAVSSCLIFLLPAVTNSCFPVSILYNTYSYMI